MNYYLNGFVHIRPRYEMDQKALLEWIAHIHAIAAHTAKSPEPFSSIKERLLQLGTGDDKIQKRGIQISDPFQENHEEMQIYPISRLPEGVGLKERMLFFEKETSEIFEQFYTPAIPLPEHIIHVTCTGYVAPSPAQKIVSKRKATHTFVTHAYHMGCYASVPAIRIALGSLSLPSPDASVDIVHTEMSSLHMHPLRNSTEQLIAQSLFADGFIKYSVQSQKQSEPCFKVLSLQQEIIPDSLESMTWRCEDVCLAMTLNKNVPVLILRALQKYFSRLAKKADVDENAMKAHAYFAIHPGGPRILQQVQQFFTLRDAQIEHSLYVLQNYGNMSSATLPHIWERMLNDDRIPAESHIASLTFGPGLSITGAIFQKMGG